MDLRQDRLNKGYSQKEYAKRLGVAERTLRYWENEEYELPKTKRAHVKDRMRKIKAKS